jgi:hypothetical protein
MFDQMPWSPNDMYLGSYSHKQAMRLLTVMITSGCIAHVDATPKQLTPAIFMHTVALY